MSDSESIPDDTEHVVELEATRSDKPASGLSTAQLRRDLQIRDTDIDGCMQEQAGLYGHYAALYAKAQFDADHAKRALEVAKAKLYRRLRSSKTASGAKFSEPLLEAEVHSHKLYIEASDLADKTRMAAALAKEALEALKQRRDMLVQIGKSRLEERKGELYLRQPEERKKHR